MKALHALAAAMLLPMAAMAQALPSYAVDASGVTLADLQWVKRPVLVFADTPRDPSFIRQMELLAEDPKALADRDVVVIVDTDPRPPSEVRTRFHPRGFSLVLMDKDGRTTIRKPLPWSVREIAHAIDKFPGAREEQLEKFPAGR